MINAVISGGLRTPIGKFGGALKETPAVKLGATVVRKIISQTGIAPESVDEVIMGHVLQAGSGQNTARQVSIASGIPCECPGYTVNKVCGSGMKSVTLATSAIRCGDAGFVVSGGMENMSMAPYLMSEARFGYRLGNAQIVDSLISDGLSDVFNDVHMGVLAEGLAEKYGISREEQDIFALGSQSKYRDAAEDGRFKAEIVPVSIDNKIFDTDEHPRKTTLEKLAALQPAFQKNGTVTAGNASGINDAACALLIANENEAEKRSLPILARIVDFVSVGLEPKMMGLGPAVAIRQLWKRNGLKAGDVDLYEINEAFASQVIAVQKELELVESRVNVNGGAIALGHPIGASGARIIVTLVHEMMKRKNRLGIASLCIGGGMGMAILIERR